MTTAVAWPPGPLRLHPGRPRAAISGASRPGMLRGLQGRPARELPALLGALHPLCGEAHRRTAARAVAAARGERLDATQAGADRLALRWTTAREQMLRLGHDWPLQCATLGARAAEVVEDRDGTDGRRAGAGPGQLQSSAAGAAALRESPLWAARGSPAEQLAALPGWLAIHWLHDDPEAWLRRYEADPQEAPAAWCATAPGPVAALLRALHDRSRRLQAPSSRRSLLDDAAGSLAAVAARLATSETWAVAPELDGWTPDTGPWTRHRDPVRAQADNAWMRITSRLADLLRLAQPEGDRWLAHGALTLDDGAGVAWSETARGVLVHWVRLERGAGGRGLPGPAEDRVAACAVLSPTAWNFHPQGVLAQAVSSLHPSSAEGRDAARVLALAFDPCVGIEIATEGAGVTPEAAVGPPAGVEACHA